MGDGGGDGSGRSDNCRANRLAQSPTIAAVRSMVSLASACPSLAYVSLSVQRLAATAVHT